MHSFSASGEYPTGTSLSSTDPVSTTFTCPAGTTVLVLMLLYGSSLARTGGAPTYNGVAMTLADGPRWPALAPEETAEMWYMLAPPTGEAYTLSVPNSNTRSCKLWMATFNSSTGASAFDVTAWGQNTSTDPSIDITTTQDGCAIVAVVGNGAQTWSPSGRSGTQLYDRDLGSWGGGCQYFLQSTAGALTVSWTFGTSDDWVIIAAAFSPVTLGIDGSLQKTLDNVTVSAGGTVDLSGSLQKTLDAVGISASGTVGEAGIDGSLQATLDAVTHSAAGSVTVGGSLQATLDNTALSAAGSVQVSGSLQATLDNTALSAGGGVEVSGSLQETLDNTTLSAAGGVQVGGSLQKILDNVSLTAGGTVGQEAINGSLDVTLAAVALSSDGAVTVSGSLQATLGDVILSAGGVVVAQAEFMQIQVDIGLASGAVGMMTAQPNAQLSVRQAEMILVTEVSNED